MLMYWPARPKQPPHGKEDRNEAVGRPNQEVQHVGIRKVSLERVEEKSTVDRLGLVCSSHIYHIHAKTSFVYNSRHAKATP